MVLRGEAHLSEYVGLGLIQEGSEFGLLDTSSTRRAGYRHEALG
jgi:hypothetical protein